MVEDEFPDEIIPGIFLGSYLCAKSKHVLNRCRVTHILTVARGLEPQFPEVLVVLTRSVFKLPFFSLIPSLTPLSPLFCLFSLLLSRLSFSPSFFLSSLLTIIRTGIPVSPGRRGRWPKRESSRKIPWVSCVYRHRTRGWRLCHGALVCLLLKHHYVLSSSHWHCHVHQCSFFFTIVVLILFATVFAPLTIVFFVF